MAGCTFSPHTCVTPVGIYWSSSSNPPPLPLHYVQGKRGGLRCYVPPGLQATQNSSLPNDALDVSPCRIALHSSRSGGQFSEPRTGMRGEACPTGRRLGLERYLRRSWPSVLWLALYFF